ncbi:MAG: ABC transporter substrate-binding protein [Mycobacteriaceae bacterium]
MRTKPERKPLAVLATCTVTALSLAGCVIQPDYGTEDGEVRTIEDDVLTVGLSPDFPPLEYLENGELIGSDVDLITEAADRMDLRVEFEHSKFDQLINSVRTDRVDIVISGMSDTVERQKTLEFVDYYTTQARFYTTPDQSGQFTTPEDVCGNSVAVSTKTDYYPELQTFNTDVCTDNGNPALKIVGTDSGAAARLQLDQGRAQLAVQGGENLAYFEQEEPGKYQIVLDQLMDQPFAAAVNKGNMALAEAVRDAFQEMYDDGTTEAILDEWDLTDGLREPVVNEVTE